MGESPSSSGRQRADARRNRDRLVAAASAVIAEAGAGASLEEIARRAGVGSATLHRHFPRRAELLEAVLRDRVRALRDRAEDLLAASSAGAALVGWLRDVVAHAATVRGLGPALTGYESDPGFSPHTTIREAAQKLLARAHREGSVESSVTVDDVLQLANGIALATESLPNPAQRADTLVALVAGGLLHPPSSRKPLDSTIE
ncbi:TetR/AcrR family transcriptional regulator [Amycolatopsis taiwanensis]|uniref:TetR family transcriptional regulator n=1 Tax=Amycolatopsis taiwanensis TaxID=342230 RepID=A0A9W6VJC8_9PSEU|nr:TetR/AcrR family transcriptional regulator [Amycolatopsis taiwanensis]GLY68361.1 TetR family transcriptional regulator [Amycolatopsis taiwanensis]